MNNNSFTDYADLGQAYAEMMVLCQPFYAFPPSSPPSPGQQKPGDYEEMSNQQEQFYLHPRLEDGLHDSQQRRSLLMNRYENPQDATTTTVVDSFQPNNSTVNINLGSNNNQIYTSTSRNSCNNNNNNNHNIYYGYNFNLQRRNYTATCLGWVSPS
jgi:hypothetical protein